MKRLHPYSAFVLIAVSIYFLAFAWPGLYSGITMDDLMNAYRAEALPALGHLADMALFFRYSDVFRPLGSLFYRAVFELFGLAPLPYRIAIYALLILNLALGFALARKLTGSREAAALCVTLFAFHGRLYALYVNTGYIYDIIAFTFFLAAFLYYVYSPRPNPLIWSALYILALNGKEIAVSLPVLLAAWELFQPQRATLWWRVPALGALITAAFIAGRLAIPASGLLANPSYHPDIRAGVYLDHAWRYVTDAAYGAKWLSGTKMAALFAAAVGLAAVWRNAAMGVGLVWMTVGILPVAFITQRELSSVYVPLFGLTLLLGETVWQAAWRVAQYVPGMTRQRWGLASFAMLLLLMSLVHRKHGRRWQAITPEHEASARVRRQMLPWQMDVQHGRTLILADPLAGWDWSSMFLLTLVAREPHLAQRPPVQAIAIYQREKLPLYFALTDRVKFDLVLSNESGRLVACDPEPLAAMTVAELARAKCSPIAGQ